MLFYIVVRGYNKACFISSRSFFPRDAERLIAVVNSLWIVQSQYGVPCRVSPALRAHSAAQLWAVSSAPGAAGRHICRLQQHGRGLAATAEGSPVSSLRRRSCLANPLVSSAA